MEKLAKSAAASSKPLHRMHLHSRFCSLVTAIFFALWVSSVLHFHSSSTAPTALISDPPYAFSEHDPLDTIQHDHLVQLEQPLAAAPAVRDRLLNTVHHGAFRTEVASQPSTTSPPPLSSIIMPPSSLSPSPSLSLSYPSAAYRKQLPYSAPLHDQSCNGKYVYMHSLPPIFNHDMISNCTHHSPMWSDFCSLTSNGGLGPLLHDENGVLAPPHNGTYSWYNTDQFILDVIFHSRMKKYACLTRNSSKADLIYVPFYAGLDITRYLWRANASVRDSLPNAFASWVTRQPEWRSMQGRDHFFVTGKISWDFRRPDNEDSSWGNKLLELQALKDVSVLLIEKGPAVVSHVEHAIPYPTYFHPHTDAEVFQWQNRMRALKRGNLFAFAGASRPEFAHSIRGELIDQCRMSNFCKLLECTRGKSGCNSPTTVMQLFQESVFCLQPSGDSYTRRSVFDSMVSGCIPVLFHPHTVYTQYNWHLPKNFSTYSVFIPEEDIKAKTAVIERILQTIPASQIEKMREKVISLIPTLIYAHPDNKLEKVKDAFDVALEGLLMKVRASKRNSHLA